MCYSDDDVDRSQLYSRPAAAIDAVSRLPGEHCDRADATGISSVSVVDQCTAGPDGLRRTA